MRKTLALVVLIGCAYVSTVDAQTVQRPTRPYRGLFGGGPPQDPNRTRKELTLTVSVLGGYDDEIIPGSSLTPVTPGQLGDSAYSGTADVALNYWHGRTTRFFSMDARTFSSTYSYVDVPPAIGGSIVVTAATDVGRKGRVSVRQIVSYEPSLVLGAFASLEGDVDPLVLPESGPGNGFLDQRSWSTGTSGSVERRWTARQSSTLSAESTRRTYLDDLGYNSAYTGVDARHRWNLNRTTSLNFSYMYADLSVGDVTGDTTPTTSHALEGAASYMRRLSATRQMQFAGGAGATLVQTIDLVRLPIEYGSRLATVLCAWISGDPGRLVATIGGLPVRSLASVWKRSRPTPPAFAPTA